MHNITDHIVWLGDVMVTSETGDWKIPVSAPSRDNAG